jgi:hypothetical protein
MNADAKTTRRFIIAAKPPPITPRVGAGYIRPAVRFRRAGPAFPVPGCRRGFQGRDRKGAVKAVESARPFRRPAFQAAMSAFSRHPLELM